jgi:hypothetical protein
MFATTGPPLLTKRNARTDQPPEPLAHPHFGGSGDTKLAYALIRRSAKCLEVRSHGVDVVASEDGINLTAPLATATRVTRTLIDDLSGERLRLRGPNLRGEMLSSSLWLK